MIFINFFLILYNKDYDVILFSFLPNQFINTEIIKFLYLISEAVTSESVKNIVLYFEGNWRKQCFPKNIP